MKLYYTVSSRQDALQAKPNLSLGGFKSSSPVSNSVFNSLFGDLSLLSLERANKEYIGLVLKNDLLQATDTIKIWLEPALNGYCKYRVAVVELSTTNEMEAIPTLYSQPMYAEFYEVNSEEESISIPSMIVGEMYGIWIERFIDENSEVYKKRNDPDYIVSHPELYQVKFEDPKLKVSFNVTTI